MHKIYSLLDVSFQALSASLQELLFVGAYRSKWVVGKLSSRWLDKD